MMTILFWFVDPCSLVVVYRSFRGSCWLPLQALKIFQNGGMYLPVLTASKSGRTAASSFHCRENLKSHINIHRLSVVAYRMSTCSSCDWM